MLANIGRGGQSSKAIAWNDPSQGWNGMDLLALADFDLVVLHGSFSEASRRTGRPKATLSRRVKDLEEDVGARLIEPGARKLRLTEAGAALHRRTRPLLDGLAEAFDEVGTNLNTPRGRLRVSAPVLFCDMAMGPIAVAFARAHPSVRLDVTAEDRVVDLLAEGYDLTIRVNPMPNERLVGRCVFRDERLLVGAPASRLPPREPSSTPLPAVVHRTITSGTRWKIRDGERLSSFTPEPTMRLSSLPMVRDAVVTGDGFSLLPRSLVGNDVATGRLTCWGVEDGPRTELWALHASRRLVSPAVRAFMDQLVASLAGFGDRPAAYFREAGIMVVRPPPQGAHSSNPQASRSDALEG